MMNIYLVGINIIVKNKIHGLTTLIIKIPLDKIDLFFFLLSGKPL